MKKLILLFLSIFSISYSVSGSSFFYPKYTFLPHQHPKTTLGKVLTSIEQQTFQTIYYDPSYVKLPYPNGDVPLERGVCADVIIRAFRAASIDLQQELHQDMKANFKLYPKIWGLKRPDPNIDHRRVANLMTYFQRKGYALAISQNPKDYLPGDVVAWRLDNGLLHIGIVSDLLDLSGKSYQVIHNIGAGTKAEPRLFEWKIIGHYRCFNVT
ncbi:MAG: DUF1287 domain-containing protein [Blastocatellia bacterium]